MQQYSDIQIRPVKMGDAEAITGIYNHYIKDTAVSFETETLDASEMAGRIRDISAHFPYLVCEKNGEILGYCYVHLWKERAAYARTLETTVYLSPDATGQGLGTRMMNQLIALCKEQGFHALVACITEGNAASIRLHESLGFKQVSCFHEVGRKFGQWLGVVDMELLL